MPTAGSVAATPPPCSHHTCVAGSAAPGYKVRSGFDTFADVVLREGEEPVFSRRASMSSFRSLDMGRPQQRSSMQSMRAPSHNTSTHAMGHHGSQHSLSLINEAGGVSNGNNGNGGGAQAMASPNSASPSSVSANPLLAAAAALILLSYACRSHNELCRLS